MDKPYILRCMYLDLYDLLSPHTYIVKKNRKTPEIKLLESRIIEMESKLDFAEVLDVRVMFDKKTYGFNISQKMHMSKLRKYLDFSQVTIGSATDFFTKLIAEESKVA